MSTLPATRSAAGFSLLELLITMAIIFIISSILIPMFQVALLKAHISAIAVDAKALHSAFKQHYVDYNALESRDTWATSAIRECPRRLDLVLHSLVVGVELLLYRERFPRREPSSAHPPSAKLHKSCCETVASVAALPALDTLLAPRGRQIFERAHSALREIA